MIVVRYGEKRYGIMVNFVDKNIYCIDFADRSRDFKIMA